ncbi:MAG: hypothetical protein RLY86_2299 [Pseudomonadota bacterium]|jgi:PAS domain S-box-containing protein
MSTEHDIRPADTRGNGAESSPDAATPAGPVALSDTVQTAAPPSRPVPAGAVPWTDRADIPAARILDSLFAFVGVLSLDGTLLQANQAPLTAAGITAADVVGRPFWECWWWEYSPAEQERLRDAVARAAMGATVRYDVDVRMAAGRLMRIDFMLAPCRDAAGRITHLIPSGVDVSQRHAAETALRDSEGRLRFALAAAGAACWDWDVETGTVYWSQEHWDLYGADPAARPSYQTWLDHVVPEDRDRAEAQVRTVLDGLTDSYETEYRIRHPRRGLRWILGLGRGERQPDGRVRRMSGLSIDITERRQTEQDLRLLMAEVDHRAKNMLAVVQAMLRLTTADTITDYRDAVEGRVAALARTHTSLADARWRGADLANLLTGEIQGACGATVDPAGRLDLGGPDVLLAADAAQAVALTLHELATNAVRHGALSRPAGTLAVEWAIDADSGLTLHWRELGGPRADRPGPVRFGTTIIDRSIGQQLGGEIRRTWSAEGLACVIRLPPNNLAAAHAPTQAATPAGGPVQPADRARRRLLVVEDAPLVALELEQVLMEAGYEVVGPAMTLERGLALAGEEALDGAVLDLNLAGRLVFPIADLLATRGVPFLFCTGYDRAILAGTGFIKHACIAKPFAAATLRAAVRDLLAPARMANPLEAGAAQGRVGDRAEH